MRSDCIIVIVLYSMLGSSTLTNQGTVPVFEGSETTNLTAHVGSTALLSCRVRNNDNNNPVSWTRMRDWHILSVDRTAYTQDERFKILHRPDHKDWTLAIRYVTVLDEGIYVCQVSTETGSVSHYYNLHIVTPRAYILGADEYYSKAGGDISLVCIIEDTLEPPQYVYWYHNNKIINYDTARTRVSFDQGEKSKKTSSRLVIAGVEKADSGNYTCTTDSALPSSIVVYVSQDLTQSLQTNAGEWACPKELHHLLLFLLFTLLG